MSQFLRVVAALAAGILLGAVHFGGLWLTVRRLSDNRSPVLLLVASYFLRGAVVFAGLLAVALAGGWQLLLVCLAGLVAVRLVLVRRLGPQAIFGPGMKENKDKRAEVAVPDRDGAAGDEEPSWS